MIGVLKGRLCNEVTYRKDKFESAKFCVVKNNKKKDGTFESSFYECIVWGESAAQAKVLKKGDYVLIYGEYKTRDHEKDGKKTRDHEINVKDLGFLKRGATKEAAPPKEEETVPPEGPEPSEMPW